MEGVSSSSTVWPILRRPRPFTHSLCLGWQPIGLRVRVTLIVFAFAMTSTQNIFDGFTALGCNIFRRFHGLQTLDGRTNHVHRVGGAVALGQYVLKIGRA